MALQVWLPLNGNLDNQGLFGNLSFTATGSVADSADGKIGHCRAFSGGYYKAPFAFTLGTAASIAGWVYYTSRPASGSNDWMFQAGTGSGFANTVLGIVTYPDKITLSIAGLSADYTYTLATGTWYHIAATWDGSVAKLYMNGSQVASWTTLNTGTKKTATNLSLGGNVAGSSTRLRGRLNDVRIYDHCLSAQEVKDLSRGLIVHYKLDSIDGSIIVDGHVIKEYTYLQSDANSWINTGVNPTSTTNFEMKYSINSISAETVFFGNGTHGYYNQGNNYSLDMNASGKLLYTFKSNGYYTSDYVATANTPFVVRLFGNNFYINDTAYDAYRASSHANIPLYLFCRNLNNAPGTGRYAGRLYYCKIYDGTTVIRDFVPVSYDGTLGLLDRVNMQFYANAGTGTFTAGAEVMHTAIDCSGNGHNGTQTGTVSFAGSTPRYQNYTDFGASSYIETDSTAAARTAVFWLKMPTTPTSNQVVFVDYKSRLAFGWHSSGLLCGCRDTSVTEQVATALTAGAWHHVAVVNTGASETAAARSVYIDGVLQSDKSSTSYWTHNVDSLQVGKRSYSTNGVANSLSDFRMYATALSASDIQDLYHTSAIVDNRGNLHTFEIIEEDEEPKITKHGDTKAGVFIEHSDWLLLNIGNWIVTDLYYNEGDVAKVITVIRYAANGSGRDLTGCSTGGAGYWGVTSGGAWETSTSYLHRTSSDITAKNIATWTKTISSNEKGVLLDRIAARRWNYIFSEKQVHIQR